MALAALALVVFGAYDSYPSMLTLIGRGKTMESQTLTVAPFSGNSTNYRSSQCGETTTSGYCR